MTRANSNKQFQKSSCILCSVNCGLDIETGGHQGRELLRIKGDKQNPASKGYLCSKAGRLNYYQMAGDRLTSPLKRMADGSYQPIDWDTAIREVAQGLQKIQREYGGDKILYIGGGGQGNHLGGLYADGLLKTLGVKYRTNALAQEKTGEFWVNGKMFGGGPHGDFEHAEVAIFLGKNPWHSHGFPRARQVIKQIAKDPNRALIVIDPCFTDTAKLADTHLAVKPGSDAWCLSAMIATIIQEGLEDNDFIEQHTEGFDAIQSHFQQISIDDYAKLCEIDPEVLRQTARRIASAKSVSVFEDLGVQQNVHSTLVSYLQRILWVITGNFAKKGAHNIPVSLLSITEAGKGNISKKQQQPRQERRSPVLQSKIIAGLLPCNTIAEEILTEHPNRFRAAMIESSNPVHSYADSPKMREAMQALEFSVVIDVAMTETARHADYILPASSCFEKYECVFFSVEFPDNYFQLRQPIVAPLPGTLAEPEIHTRLLEAIGGIKPWQQRSLALAAKINRRLFAATLAAIVAMDRSAIKALPALLYRTLGQTLDSGKAAGAAPFWLLSHLFIKKNRQYAANAGFMGSQWQAAEQLFRTILGSASGFCFTKSDDYRDSWSRMGLASKRIPLYLEELFPQLAKLDQIPLQTEPAYPLRLTAGQRRSGTTNTIIRNPQWDKKGTASALYIHPEDAQPLELASGDYARLTTQTGEAVVQVELTQTQRPGLLSLPNGWGVAYESTPGQLRQIGVAPNELTKASERDFFAGTPWHKHVAARLEKLPNQVKSH